jgi:hypothetical protein
MTLVLLWYFAVRFYSVWVLGLDFGAMIRDGYREVIV